MTKRHYDPSRQPWGRLPSESEQPATLTLRAGDAAMITSALLTTADLVERRARGLNGLGAPLPKTAARLRRLASIIGQEATR